MNPTTAKATENCVAGAAPEVLERLVRTAERARASDIHLQMRGQSAEVSFRLDGVLAPASTLDEKLAERVFGRIKFLARLKTYQDSLPQDGRIDAADLKSTNDIRVATYPTVTGEKIVLRLFQTSVVPGLAELGLPEQAWAELENFLRQPAGLMLLTGPSGSGKTTTIYACLRQLAEMGGRHVITIEDPVEQIVPGVMQTEISEPRGLDFAKAARHLLRQDPQVLVIGEIRDEETANIAIRAALTGHQVISTLHAGSCRGVFERLLLMCRDHSAVASAVELVLNQRLIRHVCPVCSGTGFQPVYCGAESASDRLGQLSTQPDRLEACPTTRPCDACLGTGYYGRGPLVEWLKLNDTLRTSVRQHELANLQPAQSLDHAVRRLISSGVTNEAERQRIFGAANSVPSISAG